MSSVESREQEFHIRVFSEATRSGVSRFYSIHGPTAVEYSSRILRDCRGKRALEFGSGLHTQAFSLRDHGASVVGIDISDVAIEKSNQIARERDPDGDSVGRMNAEQLELDDGTSDLVCGTGILHHLDLDRAYSEIARVLRPGGHAVFSEPLGHNPVINRFRSRTPDLRTPDEHPLLMSDLELASRRFSRVESRYFHITSLLAVPLRDTRVFGPVLRTLNAIDATAFRAAPFLRRYAWIVVMEFGSPVSAERPRREASV